MKEAILKSTITEIQSRNYLMGVIPIIPEHNTPHAHTTGNIGLCDAINNLIKEIMKTHPIRIIFNCFEIFEAALTNKLKRNILNIVQEHLNNIINQKKVFEINIGLSQNKNRLMLSIADDIVRFDATTRTYSDMIKVRSLEGLYTGNMNLICNPCIGNCLIYHQKFNS